MDDMLPRSIGEYGVEGVFGPLGKVIGLSVSEILLILGREGVESGPGVEVVIAC